MSFLRPKKKDENTNEVQQQLLDENRKRSEKISRAMSDTLSATAGIKDIERCKAFNRINDAFLKVLADDSTIQNYDTTELDSLIFKMIPIYVKSLKDNDIITAKRCANVMHVVFMEIRRELYEKDLAIKDTVVKKKVDKLQDYLLLLELSSKSYDSLFNYEKLSADIAEMRENNNKLFESIQKTVEEYPSVKEELSNALPGDKLSDKANDLANDMNDLRARNNALRNLISQQRQAFENHRTFENQIQEKETMISLRDTNLTESMRMYVEEANKRSEEFLRKSVEEIKEFRRMDEIHTRTIESIIRDEEWYAYTTESIKLFDSMIESYIQELEAAAEAEKIRNTNKPKVMITN